MPKVVGYTPPWLSKPSSGAKIFSDPEPQSPASPSKRSSYFNTANPPQTNAVGTRRLIASRGTEIFTVVGNKIRWADLTRVKDDWEEQDHGQNIGASEPPYRTLVTPVYYQITQVTISPSGIFLAICTEHTVHIAVLPERSRLTDHDRTPLRLKTYQLGPTIHVIPEPALAAVLWHPHAVSTTSTDCLVTITAEAAARIWEIDRSTQWSFEQPMLAVDLRKLADGVSSDQDFTPSGFGKNKGFSVDAFEMEVSAACFGGRCTPDEDPWASMTLWTAMSNGDVYALCPFLPSRWMPTSTTIPALSVTVVSRAATTTTEMDMDEQKVLEQQYEWIQEIDNEEPLSTANRRDSGIDEIRCRPVKPSAIPRLQGPFELSSVDGLEEGEITDIHVIAARLDEESLLSGEDDYELVSDGVQFTVICLSTTTGKVVLTVELDGVSGQWLPDNSRSTFSTPSPDARSLVLLDTIHHPQHMLTAHGIWPMITIDPNNVYNIFVTLANRVISISLSDWASRIGIELGGDGEVDVGLHTRLAMACQTAICVTQNVLTVDSNSSSGTTTMSAPTLVHDLNLGDMLVTHADGHAQAALFDVDSFKMSQSLAAAPALNPPSPFRNRGMSSKTLEDELPEPVPTRSAYVPAEVFYKNQMQPYEELRRRIPVSRKSVLSDNPLRLSPACLDIMTLAHKAFSVQTSMIEKAAAELFRKCDRLKEELMDQVKQMSELADRLQHIRTSPGAADGGQMTFEDRLSRAQERQKKMFQRYEKLRRKTGKVGMSNQELSAKEQTWIEEIRTLDNTVHPAISDPGTDNLSDRLATVQNLAQDLLDQCKGLEKDTPLSQSVSSGRFDLSDSMQSRKSAFSVSSRMQKERIGEVMAMVERESVIIEAVMARLNKLNAGS